jgi:AraC family transcriptional regulator of arabinose operon
MVAVIMLLYGITVLPSSGNTDYERFHKHVDMSVAAYMKQERLNAAKKLIVETSRPINVIARECGYSCSLILIRTLKRDTGMTPRAYRRERQG